MRLFNRRDDHPSVHPSIYLSTYLLKHYDWCRQFWIKLNLSELLTSLSCFSLFFSLPLHRFINSVGEIVNFVMLHADRARCAPIQQGSERSVYMLRVHMQTLYFMSFFHRLGKQWGGWLIIKAMVLHVGWCRRMADFISFTIADGQLKSSPPKKQDERELKRVSPLLRDMKDTKTKNRKNKCKISHRFSLCYE